MEGTCQTGVKFKAIEGMIITGSITPVISEAQVTVHKQLQDGSFE